MQAQSLYIIYQLYYIYKIEWNLRIRDMLGQGVLSSIVMYVGVRLKCTEIGINNFVIYKEK